MRWEEPEKCINGKTILLYVVLKPISFLTGARPILQKSVLRFEEEKRKAIRWRKDFEKKQRLDRESLLDANASSSSSTDSENEETIQGFPPSRIIIHVHTSPPSLDIYIDCKKGRHLKKN